MKVRNVVIVDGCRSAFSRGGRGKLESTRLDELGADIVRALLERNPKVKSTMIEDFGIGNGARPLDLTFLNNVSRLAGLPYETANFYTDRHCASSMEAILRITMGIALGSSECGIAFGIERMNNDLMGGFFTPPTTRVNCVNPNVGKPTKLQRDIAPDHFDYFSIPIPEYILDSDPMATMVQTAQNVAEMYKIRRDEMDAYTVKSHQKYTAAFERGIYRDEIIPLEVEEPVFDEQRRWVEDARGAMVVFDKDECVRPDATAESLATLPPIRSVVSYGNQEIRITAGNSCPTNSGASAVLLMSEKKALKLGLQPLARIIGWGIGGVKQQIMGVGPVVSTKKAFKHAGITAEQVDRVEFNEAFACQVIATLRELGISEEIVNVNGGSLGIGHPIGATGGRLVLTLAKELRRSGKRYGVATQCIGAGQGATTIIEALY